MDRFEVDDLIDKEYQKEEDKGTQKEIERIISNLQLYSNSVEMLTRTYTDILTDDNVVYIMTRVSQNPVFMNHFPEFYAKNVDGESVINCQQNSIYHRYGVFKHILYTIEHVGKDNLRFSTHDMKILKWTMLLHDIGKPMAKTINSEGYDSFTGHDDISVEIADKILDRFDFNQEDKKIILTLIKYHDKFLNEGDLTYDNLSFLAQELEDKKDLFHLLIEVKIADNRAKSVDVYNKFMTVVGKYYDFANEYFSNSETNKLFENINDDEIISSNSSVIIEEIVAPKKTISYDDSDRGIYKEGGSDEDITEAIISELTKDITAGNKLQCYYQPIVDLKKRIVNGYEVFYKIITVEDFSYKQIIRKAKEFGKYDKLQQMLFVNALERFNEIKGKQNIVEYVNIDAKSYQNYVNKARIFDLLDKNNVVLEFNNFETLINSKIKELSHEIFLRKGNVAIDNFESSNKTMRDLEQIEPKYIKYKIEDTEENTKEQLKELVRYGMLNSANLIVFGVDTREILDFAIECGVRYVQGNFFGKPADGLELSGSAIEEKLNGTKEELIV